MGTRVSGGLDTTTPRPAPQRPDPCADDCTPRCPACGGLKCLCRPRFFSGQLLTDEDLTSLEQYVIDKNRLHNRYLVGWGVACGLEVACDPCDPRGVVVRSGYAVSPCGDDIVVCNDAAVDICALIESCNQQAPQCDGPYQRPPRDCRSGHNEWVLAICYDERPVRGVTAQIGAGDTPASAKCSCGGAGASGCGCGGHAKSSTTKKSCGCSGNGKAAVAAASKKTYKPECEPTRICEGYHFVTYPAPPADLGLKKPDGLRGVDQFLLWLYANRSRFGPLLERVLCCALRAMQFRAAIREGQKLDQAFAQSTYVDYAAAIDDFASDFAVHHCAFVAKTAQIRTDALTWTKTMAKQPFDANAQAALTQKTEQLDDLWLELIGECLCSALLPACPAPAPDNCVPLAVVTLKPGDCRVAEICNWDARKLLITWPTVSYWLSWLPWGNLRKWISGICCGPNRGLSAYYVMMLMFGVTLNSLQSAAEAMTTRKKVADAGSANVMKAMGADSLLSHMADDFDRLRSEASPGDPAWAGLAARLASFSPDAVSAVAPPSDTSHLARRLEVAELQLRNQDQQIQALKKKVR